MQQNPHGSPPDRNGRRFSPASDRVPLRGDGRSNLPPNGQRPDAGEQERRMQLRRPPREDLRAMGRGVRQTWQSVVRVMGLVWATSPQLTSSLAGATLLQSVMPAA